MSKKQPSLDFTIPQPEPPTPEDDQRTEADRRKSDKPYDGPDRRHGDDRRGLSFGLRFTTGRRLSDLEEWLDDNCGGGYHLAIEDMSEDLGRKTVRMAFSRDEDRQKFRQHFAAPKGGGSAG